MKIGFATADWGNLQERPGYGGAGWARIGLPAKFLRQAGLDVVEGTLIFNKATKTFGVRCWPEPGEEAVLHGDIDLVVLQRWMFASVAVETASARRKGQVVVNDLDDHFWALSRHNRARVVTDPRHNLIENRDHYAAVLRSSSAVTVSTPFLADIVRRELGVKAPIHVLENHLDLEAWDEVAEVNMERVQAPALATVDLLGFRRPIVGWVGATPWRSGDLEVLQPFLGKFLDRHGLTAYHGGHVEAPGVESFAQKAGIDPTLVRTKPMAPIDEYPVLFRGLDVGLVPLADCTFNRAKSWIKGIEYAAAGVPFVASDSPAYRRLRERHGIGRIAIRPRDWVRHLGALQNEEVRLAEAEDQRIKVKALDIRQGINNWRDLYLDLLANN